jgi:tetratricopeptide (TPR) repeat protein
MRCARANALVECCVILTAVAGPANGEDMARGESVLLEQVRIHPESFDANHALGEFYIQQHRLLTAVPYLEKARQIEPANYENAYDLALTCLQAGQSAKSRQVIAGLLRQRDGAELHNLLGDVEEADGHVQEAAEQYETAARMDPSEKNVFDLGSDLMRHRGFEPALKVFVFGTERHPRSARLRVGLGTAHYALGQYDEAVESLCQAVDLDPQDTKALDFLGKMYDVSQQFASEVRKRLEGFARAYPDNAAANYYYALSLRQRANSPESGGTQAEAERLLLRAVKLKPEYAEAQFELALLYEDEKQEAQAIRQYQIAIRLGGPSLAKAHYRLGRLYQRNGQAGQAQKEFDAFEALKGKP